MADTRLIEAALEPLRQSLNADGYELAVEQRESSIAVRVIPGADACQECLVPKPLFLGMVEQVLRDAGIHGTPPLELAYPADDGQH